MSTPINDGGPAFPQPNHIVDHEAHGRTEARQWMQDSGMSLRDWFAGQALAGMSSSDELWVQMREAGKTQGLKTVEAFAGAAYEFADAMLVAREKKP